MAIQDDFTIHPYTKVIRHDPTKSTVYSAVAFYSWLQDVFDEPGFLSYQIPIRFNTPTSFTMVNGWFLDDGDGSNLLQYLTGGGIDTLNYATIADPVVMIDLDTQVGAWVPSDLDEVVRVDGADIGPLLSYKENYPTYGLSRIWVRDQNSVGTVLPGQIVDSYPGNGSYLAADYSQSGDNIYHNLFTIAAFPGSPNPQIYIYQDHPVTGNRVRIAEWSAFDNWDRGTIDILITTQLAGSLIDGGNIASFVRQTADTFTFVESTLTTSGRTPIATETSADEVNITIGEHYMFYDGASTPTFTAGDIITNVPIGIIDTDLTPPSWYAEIVDHTAWTTATGYLILRGLRGTPEDGDNIYTGSGDTVDSTANVNGKVGDTLLNYTGGTDPTVIDQVMTGSSSGARRRLSAVDTTEEILLLRITEDPNITGTNRDPYYRDFTALDTVTGDSDGSVTPTGTTTTLISGFTDITIAHMNGTVNVDTFGGTFTEGERVTWNGGEAIMIYTDGSSIMMLGNVTSEVNLNDDATPTVITGDLSTATCEIADSSGLTDENTQNFEFSLQTTGALYSVFIEGGSIYETGRSLTDIYAYLQFYLRDGQGLEEQPIYTSDGSSILQVAAEEYIKADAAYNATKAAPYGTLAGGVFFGAQAVWLQGQASSDANNINLTDSTGFLRQPFTTISISVTNTRADDRVAIFLESGSTELPDKAQYTSADSPINALGDTTFQRNSGAFPNDTPTSGTFIVVDNTLNKQHRYRYASRNGTTDPGILTTPTEITGTADGTTASEILEDSGFNFVSNGVIIGDIIHRTNNSLGFAYVTGNATSRGDGDTDILNTTLIEDTDGVADTAWSSGDTYAIFSLVKTYRGSDTFFIPYMDTIEDTGTDGSPGSIDVTLTYVADREIILEVRNVQAATEIIPFKTTGTITISGYTQGVIRNEDTVTT